MNINKETMKKLFEGNHNFIVSAENSQNPAALTSFYTQMKTGLDISRLTKSSITSSQRMWDAMKSVFYADELSYMMGSLKVNYFKQFSSDWVSALESRIDKLNAAGNDWHSYRHRIMDGFLSPVISFSNTYSSVNEQLLKGKNISSEGIKDMIEALHKQTKEQCKKICSVKSDFDKWISSVTNIVSLLNDSMEDGWKALDVEESSVVMLAEKMTLLQNFLEETMEEIMPAYIDQTVDLDKSYGEIVYSVLIAGEAVSYLSVGGLFISVGTLFYDALSSHLNIVSYAKEINQCKQQYSLKQQALIQTKYLLRFLGTLLLQVSSLKNEFDGIIDIWEEEESYLNELLLSYNRGADPIKTILVPRAAEWETLSGFARKILFGNVNQHNFSRINL